MEKQITAAEIHADFYGAEERLYVEAIGLSQGGLVTKASKAERLKKIGFGASKAIKQCEEQEKRRSVSGHLIKAIEYFRTYYPQNKFITEAEVKRLCEKYGLLLGDASNFVGDIPEKNLVDIEKFKLRKEDWKEKSIMDWMSNFGMMIPSTSTDLNEWGFRRQEYDRAQHDNLVAQYLGYKSDLSAALGISQSRKGIAIGVDPYKAPEKKKEYEQPAFKICAPKEDFDTRGWEVRDGYRLVYDPVVLQPVSKDGIEGYLIITAWGEEASDEIVQNGASN